MEKTIVIIDGNSLINRAYYAMQRPMITKEGIYTQGIYGFINMLTKIKTDYEPGYMAVALFGMKNHNIYAAEEVAPVLYNFEAYIGQEYYLTVKACDFEQNPVITAQVKLTSLEDGAAPDGESRHFSIEIVSYEYSDFYKMMEGAS